MAVVPMQKVGLLIHLNDKPKVLSFLQEKGILQVTDTGTTDERLTKMELDKEGHELEYNVAELDFAINFLAKYEEKKKGLQAIIDGDTVKTDIGKISEIVKGFDYEEIVKQTKTIEEEMVSLQNEVKGIEALKDKLRPWNHFKHPLSTSFETKNTTVFFVSVPLKESEGFKKELAEVSELIDTGKENADAESVYIQILCDKSVVNDISGLINRFKAESVELPALEGTVSEEMKKCDEKLKKIEQREGQLVRAAITLSKELKNLRVAYDFYNWHFQQKLARRNFASTESIALIKGWMPKKSIERVRNDISGITVKSELFEIEPEKDESAPVLLLNKGLMKPFQSVTGIYGLPLPNELDPTPYLAIFFIVFYGLALTDAAYGFLMFAIMFVTLRFFRIPKESQGLLRLLMYAGIVTFILGALFGGWASLSAEQAPSWMTYMNDDGKLVFIGQKINAIENPLNVLILSLALGYIQVLVGVIMNFVWRFRKENRLYAMVDDFPWVYLLSVIGFAIAQKAGLLPESLWGVIKVLLYIGFAGIVFTQGREKKNIVLKFLSGVLGLYGLVGYLSDVLSYSRLLALGLATSIIGLAVNTIAGLVNGVPVVGVVLAIIVLIVGHIFNLGINALGAFIHSGRLQFVEFFTKFMEGGGRAFKPLRRDSRYVRYE